MCKLNNSLKIQRDFQGGVILTSKKIRKIFKNIKLLETKSVNLKNEKIFHEKMKSFKGVFQVEAGKFFKQFEFLKNILNIKFLQ